MRVDRGEPFGVIIGWLVSRRLWQIGRSQVLLLDSEFPPIHQRSNEPLVHCSNAMALVIIVSKAVGIWDMYIPQRCVFNVKLPYASKLSI